jgi:hypothetical protein
MRFQINLRRFAVVLAVLVLFGPFAMDLEDFWITCGKQKANEPSELLAASNSNHQQLSTRSFPFNLSPPQKPQKTSNFF